MKGDISHVTNVFLVLTDGLGPGNDGVSDIAIVAPAYEGLPVIVQITVVHLLTLFFTSIKNHLNKVSKTNSTIVGVQISAII